MELLEVLGFDLFAGRNFASNCSTVSTNISEFCIGFLSARFRVNSTSFLQSMPTRKFLEVIIEIHLKTTGSFLEIMKMSWKGYP